ncbi:beta-N-acetylhexosaminidase [Thermobispora bispora]|uniref:beta-N-acetylhexosaminidase n=1 Tax=Thermobispora bispora (strain ATCC 19993 / DSM 43833 / CBS 139.67 / JCM 10125 / KCTC 9307 / NBRC 14880 / R51) TaxID=469371 RepID=D6Y9L2_THEBD|nr:beta-N-acetylhexosaminidase [Thermobispora bispora]ADG90043.1 Beta-N-acetylhexosaminidase [Thermobispora bispora DSM 43833]
MEDLLPRPRVAERAPGAFGLSSGAAISGPAGLVDAVRLALPVLDLRPGSHAAIQVAEDPSLGPEAYGITITAAEVRITAADRAGAHYAGQTLRQLLPAEAFRAAALPGVAWALPCGRIADAPAFPWRGAHLDVARHFFPKREVLRLIDLLAAHKLNRLHLHLSDDQGWRVESRAYPRLHEVGSHRDRTVTGFHGEEPAFDGIPHGGHYTLHDLAEIAAYARARAVTVVPEIDVPGHSSAILAAYPELGPLPEKRYRVLDRWGISPAILSPLPATVDFLATVFDEIIGALGPTPYFHIGGDECVLDDWAASERVRAYQAELGLDSPSELHAWFLHRLADLLAERGVRAVVWDEAFVSGRLRPDTVVMAWRGMEVARRAAAAGHETIAAPVFPMYLDYAEASSAEEPAGLGDATTVADVAAFAPAPAEWTAEERARVIGTQFLLWSEWIPDGRTLDYRAWPRGCAAAEVAWTGHPADQGFTGRLGAHLKRLDALGVEYRPLTGPRPWQRGGTGWRRHRPGRVRVTEVMRHLAESAAAPGSARPNL